MAAALLPVLQGSHANSEKSGELLLGESILVSNRRHIRVLEIEGPGRLGVASEDGACFTDACCELLKQFLFHLNSSLTIDAN